MPTYAYTQSSGSTTVEYNITPAFSAGFNLSGSVTVTGRVKNTSYSVAMVDADLNTSSTKAGGSSYMYGSTYVSGKVNTWTPFSITLTTAGRVTFPSGTQAAKVYLIISGNLNKSSTLLESFVIQTSKSAYLFNWHTSAHIADGSGIVRCDGNGIQRPDGNRLRFENFQVLTHASSSLTRITFQVMQSGASSGSTYTVPSGAVTIAKLTSSPYTESTPSFFPTTLSLSSAYSYTILISFTDAYETTQQSLGIPRGAPILDFSLADKGGLAVGQYSSSTDTEPRFEVAYPTYLAGGLVLTPGETRATKGGQLMMTGIRFGRHKFTQSVAANSSVIETVTLKPEFNTDRYVVLLTQMGENVLTSEYKVGKQTSSSFEIKCSNKSTGTVIPVYNWLAIEGSTDDSSDLTEGGSPATYPENILRGTGSPSQLLKDSAGIESSDWANGTWSSASSGNGTCSVVPVTNCPDAGITAGFRISGNTSGNRDIGQANVPLSKGQVYTASCWARVQSGSAKLQVRIFSRAPSSALAATAINGVTVNSTTWNHLSGTFTIPSSNAGTNYTVLFGILGSGSTLDLCGFKLEQGSNANPTWTANPQD